ncbi:DUF2625 domain-containing protein [Streptomyces sp. NBC_01378]|uniref:DUF2625 family protein n=1 Tax=Streptomyces sp. NBC_01378 TaxID=2903844 RepID=UPI003248B4C4
MREVDELINVEDPAWPLLLQKLTGSDVPVEVLPGDAEMGRASLMQLQVSARSDLGGMVLNCGRDARDVRSRMALGCRSRGRAGRAGRGLRPQRGPSL